MSTLEAPIPDSLVAPADRARKLAGNVWNRWIAVLVGVATLSVYWITLSPGVSFWDSGEFIATSHSLDDLPTGHAAADVRQGEVLGIVRLEGACELGVDAA